MTWSGFGLGHTPALHTLPTLIGWWAECERFAEPHDGAVRASARAGFQLSRSTYAPGPGVDGGGIAPWKRGAGSRSGTATAT